MNNQQAKQLCVVLSAVRETREHERGEVVWEGFLEEVAYELNSFWGG